MIARKHRKAIIILTILTTIITIISVTGKFIIGMYLRYGLNINPGNDASSIGIIGRSDGPTSIF